MTSGSRKQRGTTLIIALIMLVLLTLFAVSSFNTANTNLKVVGNMQQRSEALNAAQGAIESVISTPLFIANPANAVLNPCGTANTLCTDVTGDGTADFTTTLVGPDYPAPPHQPTCSSMELVKNLVLDGVGVGVLPYRVAAHGVSAGRLLQLGDELPGFDDTITLVRRYDLPMTAGSRTLIDSLLEHARAMPPLSDLLRSQRGK